MLEESHDKPGTVPIPPLRAAMRTEQLKYAHQLLTRIGLAGYQKPRVFIGPMYAPDDPDEPAVEDYVPARTNGLWEMYRYAAMPMETTRALLAWDGQELTVTFTDGPRTARFELTRLSPGQESLLARLNTAFMPDNSAARSALDVPDEVAKISARICLDHRGRDFEPADEIDADDPLGLLAFAEVLTRAGVADWPQPRRARLERLADGWSGTASELLDVATVIQS